MNLIGFWHCDEQTRFGELERKVYDEKKFRKGHQDCQDDCQNCDFCGLAANVYRSIPERMKSAGADWKWKIPMEIGKVTITMVIIIGFAAMRFAMWTL